MWTWITGSFAALSKFSPLSLVLSVAILVVSLIEAFRTKKSWRERWPKAITVVLSLLLLFAQAESSRSSEVAQAKDRKSSEAKATADLEAALQRQQGELTSAFKAGTDEVIKATQGDSEHVIEAARGSTECPRVFGGPDGFLHIGNDDLVRNMYDVSVTFSEMNQSVPDTREWDIGLQTRTAYFPIIGPRSHLQIQFPIASRQTSSYFSLELRSRRQRCYEQLGLVKKDGDWHHAVLYREDNRMQIIENGSSAEYVNRFPAPPQPNSQGAPVPKE